MFINRRIDRHLVGEALVKLTCVFSACLEKEQKGGFHLWMTREKIYQNQTVFCWPYQHNFWQLNSLRHPDSAYESSEKKRVLLSLANQFLRKRRSQSCRQVILTMYFSLFPSISKRTMLFLNRWINFPFGGAMMHSASNLISNQLHHVETPPFSQKKKKKKTIPLAGQT